MVDAQERFPFLAEVTSDKVNIRAGGNTNFEQLDRLKKGDQVIVVAKSYNWYKIQLLPTAQIYVRADYVELVDGDLGQIKASSVNVRAGKSADAVAVGQLKKDDYVKVKEKIGEWDRIEPMEGIYGWVHQDFIRFKSHQIPDAEIFGLVKLKPTLPFALDENRRQLSPQKIMVTGRIEQLDQGSANADLFYKLTVNGQIAYYVRRDTMIDAFTHSLVNVEGEVQVDAKQQAPYPALSISKLNLIL